MPSTGGHRGSYQQGVRTTRRCQAWRAARGRMPFLLWVRQQRVRGRGRKPALLSIEVVGLPREPLHAYLGEGFALSVLAITWQLSWSHHGAHDS